MHNPLPPSNSQNNVVFTHWLLAQNTQTTGLKLESLASKHKHLTQCSTSSTWIMQPKSHPFLHRPLWCWKANSLNTLNKHCQLAHYNQRVVHYEMQFLSFFCYLYSLLYAVWCQTLAARSKVLWDELNVDWVFSVAESRQKCTISAHRDEPLVFFIVVIEVVKTI